MNRGELRTEIKDRLAIPSSGDGLITDSYVNSSINNALSRISAERDWWWLAGTSTPVFSTTTGFATLPSDFMRAQQLVINGAVAQAVPFETYLDADNSDVGNAWVIYGNNIALWPIPSTAPTATFYYFRNEPALSSDGSTPLMPATYHYSICSYAAYLCAARRQDETRASLYLQEYGNWLKTMNDDNRTTIQKRIKFNRTTDYAVWE